MVQGVDVMFDERGLPWTIRLSLGWTIILALFSAGVVLLPLGLYLAYWVRSRQGGSAAFWCYTAVIVFSIMLLIRGLSPQFVGAIAMAGLVLFLVAPHVLRAEIISLYQRSWNINLPISHVLTFLFASVYLNYSIPDLPVPPSDTIASHGAGALRFTRFRGRLKFISSGCGRDSRRPGGSWFPRSS
jgi:hypothetical protein